MRANQDSEADHNLDRVLKQWVLETPLPPRFSEQVWQRIGRAETSEKGARLWGLLGRLVGTHLPRPKFAVSYLAILLLVGVISGAWAAQRRTSRLNSSLEFRYVQSIDPYHHGLTSNE